MKFTIEADSDYEVLEAMRTICLSEPEKGLILDQQIERLEADNARRKPEPVLWAVTYNYPGKPRCIYSGYPTLPEAEEALRFHQTRALPDEEPENFKLVALYEC